MLHGNAPEKVVNDDSKQEDAALEDILARNVDFTRQHPWPHYTSRIDVLHRPTFVLATSKSVLLEIRSLSYTVYHKRLRDSYKWECIEEDGWLRFRDTAKRRYLGIIRLSGKDSKEQYLLCLSNTMVEKTRFCLRLMSDDSALLLVPLGGELRSMKAILDVEKLPLDESLDEQVVVETSNATDKSADLIHVRRGRKVIDEEYAFCFGVSD